MSVERSFLRAVALVLSCAALMCTFSAPVVHAAKKTPPATTSVTPAEPSPLQVAARRLFELRRTSRWPQADSLADSLAAVALPMGRDGVRAVLQAALAKANSAWSRKAYRDTSAIAGVHRALALLAQYGEPAPELESEARLYLARILWETDRYDEALPELERSRDLRIGAYGARDTLVAEVWYEIGFAKREHAQPEGAIEAFTRALDIQRERLGEQNGKYAQTLGRIGECELDLRHFEAAREKLERAVAIVERNVGPDAFLLQFPLLGLSRLEEETGSLARGIDLQERALAVVQKRYPTRPIITMPMHGNLGIQRLELGDALGAAREFATAYAGFAKAFGDDHSRTTEARAYLGIAAAQLGDTATAWRHLRAARENFESSDAPDPEEYTQVLRWQAQLLANAGDTRGALALSARTLAVADSATGVPADILVELHRLRIDLQRAQRDTAALAASVRALTNMLGEPGVVGSPAHAMLRLARAEAEAALGARDSAWADALASEALSRAQLELNARALPDRQALGLANALDQSATALVHFVRPGHASDVREAWERLAAWHGLVNDAVAGRRVPASALADTAIAAAYARWQHADRALAQLLVNGARAGRDAHWNEAYAAAQRSAEAAERALADRAPVPHTAAPEALSAVIAATAPNEAFVTYVSDASDLTSHLRAFVARGHGAPVLVDLGALNTLTPAIARWRAALATPPGTAGAASELRVRLLGGAVRARVWDPLAKLLAGATRVNVVEDGPVAQLAWQALPNADGTTFAERGPLLEVLTAERRRLVPEAAPAGALLALGGADFGAAPHDGAPELSAALRGTAPCTGWPTFPPLPGTRAEASAIAAIWQRTPGAGAAQVLQDTEANEHAFRAAAPHCEVLHLATHGFVSSDTCGDAVAGLRGVGGVVDLAPREVRPSRPSREPAAVADPWVGRRVWLALAGANAPSGDADDGVVTAEEVATLDLSGVRWAVLSACHSGVSEAWTRQGAAGMARAFHLAGASTVIASQWSISDEATLAWMEALYDARARGITGAAEAMRAASRTVLAARRKSGQSVHPFYWAAFTASRY